MGSWFSTVWDSATSIPNLRGKVAIVTGANAGIGYEVTSQLARHEAKVYLASRSESRVLAAMEKLYVENPKIEKGLLVWLPLDLADLNSVAGATQTVLDREERLDILVSNAGIAAPSFQTTPRGCEGAVGVNHLGHFLFTINLLPLMMTTAAGKDSDVRIVTVSSSAHSMLVPVNLRFDKLDDFKYPGMPSANWPNILFAKELQRRLDADKVPIISTTLNPGGNNTEGAMSIWPGWMRPIMSRLFAPPSKGAVPILYLASAPEIKWNPVKHKALYYNPSCKPETPSALSRDPQVAENLRKTSEGALAAYIKT